MGRQDEIVKERIKKLEELKKLGINPYISKYKTKNITIELQKEYSKIKFGDKNKISASISGRLMVVRDMGKISFGTLYDGHGKMQIVLQEKETPQKTIDFFKKYIDSGDFIAVEGHIFRTQRGELSILADNIVLLTKSIFPLPEKWHGIQDSEERLRKRYLDILMNLEVKDIFIRKAKFWATIRNFLTENGFLEVETPVLENSAGGASANPFATHHNALDMDVYLRISMGELWQKKLMVAGFPKTFEIGRQFRNEGMDAEHLQDYSQMEFYWAYANYLDGMKLVEDMYRLVAKEVYGKTKFKIGDHEFDLSKKWENIDYADTIKKMTKIDIFNAKSSEIEEKLKELKVEYERNTGRSTLIDSLWKYCRSKIAGPTFLLGTPVEVSPLAKRDSKDLRKTERFQIIIGGSEVGNGYSELNDPIDQEQRFTDQQAMKDAGDTEAQSHDIDFVEALKYGMPPTCGFGVSERLFSFLEGKPIRETVIFPLMKPLDSGKNKKPSLTSTPITPAAISDKSSNKKLPITREKAIEELKKYNKEKSDLNHYLESEAVMREVAKKLGEDPDYYGMLGLLHDIDWGITKNNVSTHLKKAPQILKNLGFDSDFIEIILSHGYGYECANLQDKKRSRKIEYALASSETITGLIHSYALMRKTIEGMEVSGLHKKFKDKKFAAGVDRDIIMESANLGLSLEEFFELAINAISSIAKEVDLVK